MGRRRSPRRRYAVPSPTAVPTRTSSSEETGMLSRVAEALFWVGRYVERAEDTARLLDVHFHEVLEDPGVDEAHACGVLLSVMGVPADTADTPRDSRAVLELLGYAEGSSSSIVGALSAAWENARRAREGLSADIWECLNFTQNSLQTRVGPRPRLRPGAVLLLRPRARGERRRLRRGEHEPGHELRCAGPGPQPGTGGHDCAHARGTDRLRARERGLGLTPSGLLRPRCLPAYLPAGRRRAPSP